VICDNDFKPCPRFPENRLGEMTASEFAVDFASLCAENFRFAYYTIFLTRSFFVKGITKDRQLNTFYDFCLQS
jgi:hypothetical protein